MTRTALSQPPPIPPLTGLGAVTWATLVPRSDICTVAVARSTDAVSRLSWPWSVSTSVWTASISCSRVVMSPIDVALASRASSAARWACAEARRALTSTNCAVWSMAEKSIDDATKPAGMPLRKSAILAAGTLSVTAPLTIRPAPSGCVVELTTYPPRPTPRAITPSNDVRKLPGGTV